jgi:TolB protein
MKSHSRILPLLAFVLVSLAAFPLEAQDWVHTGTNLGSERLRIAAANFKPVGNDPQTAALKATFDATLYSDLSNAGIFDMVSKSMIPQAQPGAPQEINLSQWSAPPSNALMVAFGALAANKGRLIVYGWLEDTRNLANPQVLGKQYNEKASLEEARTVAHQFANEIILRLGGGINGIAESKIFFISSRKGAKEVWEMDYDGQNQHPVTHTGSICLSPRVSPDGARVAFASLSRSGWAIRVYSLELGRLVSFSAGIAGGSNQSPAWSGDGSQIAFSSSRSGSSQIWIASAGGGSLRRITSSQGPNVSPTWNPRTGGQLAWVNGHTGLPQIYIMDQDGSGVQRMTDGGYAVSPSWSPNGQFLAFSWNRKYGPGVPGGRDIYVMDIASKRWLQLTHGSGSNDFPSWSPDGRHIVFERGAQIWTMLADGTEQRQLTHSGGNFMPNWSWK